MAEFDVCPTAEGDSIASLDQVLTFETTTHAGRLGRVGTHSTASVDTASDFRGKVDDSATLGTVTQNYHQDEQWIRTAAAADGPEARHEGAFEVTFNGIDAGVPGAQGSEPTPGDFSAVEGTFDMSGDATQENIAEAGVSAAFDFATMAPAFVAAEILWRNSRCVMVAVPEYGAESEFEVRHQGFPFHTEKVDKGSETPFEARLKHRFGQTVTATIEAELAGKEQLTPSSIAQPPGTLTYTAPDEDAEKATVKMTSTSKQGIGILAIAFDVRVQRYEVTIVRETTGGPWDPTTLTLTAVIEPGERGVLEGNGRASGSELTFDWMAQQCKQEPYSGVALVIGEVRGETLFILLQLEDRLFSAGFLAGEAPQSGGTTHQERAPELTPGEQPPVGATCYAWSTITQSLTVRPLEPEP